MDRFKKGLKWFFNSFIWLGFILLFLDILSKNLVVINQDVTKTGVEIIPGFLRIQYIVNPSIAFGLNLGNEMATKIVFSIVAILITIGIIAYLVKKWVKVNRFFCAALMMIIAGAIGNVIDRLFYSDVYLNFVDSSGNYVTGVVDWIDFYGIWGFHFNIADSCVVIAAFMLIIYMIIDEIKEFNKRRKVEKVSEEKEDKNEKVLSKTELEKQRLLEEDKAEDDQNNDK